MPKLGEDIWDTISVQADSMDLSEDEKKLIDERLDAFHSNPDAGTPWNEIYKRIIAGQGI